MSKDSWDYHYERTFYEILKTCHPSHHSVCSMVAVVRNSLPKHKEIAQVVLRRITEVNKTSAEAKSAWFVLDALMKDVPWLFISDVAGKLPDLVEKHLDWDSAYALALFEGWRKLFVNYAANLLGTLEVRLSEKLKKISEAKKAAEVSAAAQKRPREETHTTEGQKKILGILSRGKGVAGGVSTKGGGQNAANNNQEVNKDAIIEKYSSVAEKFRRAIKLGHIPSSRTHTAAGPVAASGAGSRGGPPIPPSSTLATSSSAILPTSMEAPTFQRRVHPIATPNIGGRDTTGGAVVRRGPPPPTADDDEIYIPKYN